MGTELRRWWSVAGLAVVLLGAGCPSWGGDDDRGDDDDATFPADDDDVADDDDATTDDDDDDDDDDSTGPCDGPSVTVSESEPNDLSTNTEYDTVTSEDGEVTITGSMSLCDNDGSSWTGDADWFVVRFECVGEASVELSWDGGASDMDLWVGDEDGDELIQGYSISLIGPESGTADVAGDIQVRVNCWEGQPADYTLSVRWDQPGDDDDATGDDDDVTLTEPTDCEPDYTGGTGVSDTPCPSLAPACPASPPDIGTAGGSSAQVTTFSWDHSQTCTASFGPWIYLNVPADTQSLALTVDGGDAATAFSYVKLGDDVLFDWSGNDAGSWSDPPLLINTDTAGGFVMPNNEATAPGSGCLAVRPIAWDVDLTGQVGNMYIMSHRGTPAAVWDLNIVIVDGAGIGQTALAPVVTLMNSMLQANNAGSVGTVTYDTITTTAGAWIDSIGADINALRATSVDCDPNRVNVFFIADFLDRSLAGIAGGVPGPFGIQGTPASGVVISTDSHLSSSGNVLQQYLAETITHEIGHQIGLYHTTESGGTFHDPIGDTPECPTSADADSDGSLSASECDNYDGHNVMFWSGASWDQDEISATQADVVSLSPAWD